MFFLNPSADVAAFLRRVIEPAFIEERFDEGDDGALIVGGQVGRTPEPGQEPGGARGRQIIAHGCQPHDAPRVNIKRCSVSKKSRSMMEKPR